MGGAGGQWRARGGAAGRWSRRERGRWNLGGRGGAGASETPGRGRARPGAACRAGGGRGGAGRAPAPPRSFPAGGRRAEPGPGPGEAGEAPLAAGKSLGRGLGEPGLPSGHRGLEGESWGLPVFGRCHGSRSWLVLGSVRFLENKARPGIRHEIKIGPGE